MAVVNLRFADGVRHLLLPGLNEISNLKDSGMRAWLAGSSSFVPINFENDSFFDLSVFDTIEPLEAYASDINRLACASLETINTITASKHNEKCTAWNLIKYYYSAFYSAHCLLKALGFGLIQIDETIIRNIKGRCIANGDAVPVIRSGIYCIELSKQPLRFYRIKRYDDSHRGLWNRFSDFLGVLEGVLVCSGSYDTDCIRVKEPSEEIPSSFFPYLPKEDANTASSIVNSIRGLLNSRGDYNWLSFVRNNINYSHGYGVWYPYKGLHKTYKKVLAMKEIYRQSIFSPIFSFETDEEIIRYIKGCQMINAMNYDVIQDLYSRHPENKSFLKKGVISFVKHYLN